MELSAHKKLAFTHFMLSTLFENLYFHNCIKLPENVIFLIKNS